jgi:head-tail adaptor
MTAGRRRDKIVIQRATVSQDALGEETPSWSTLATEWAAVFYGKGDERRLAAMEEGRQSATFQVPSNSNTRSVGVKDRISHLSSSWDIVGVAPDVPKPGTIEFTAVRAL